VLDRNWLTIGSLILALPLAAVEPGVKVQFVGGTVSGIAAKANSHLDLTGDDTLLFHFGREELGSPTEKSTPWSMGRA
jgi:hypothetical protein